MLVAYLCLVTVIHKMFWMSLQASEMNKNIYQLQNGVIYA